MADLDSNTSPNAGQVSLADGPVTIGRSSRNSVVLSSSAVSREHCTIARERGRAMLRDLGSKHGTKVNGLRVSETPLLDGDVIRIGRFELTYVATDAPAASDASADLDAIDDALIASDERDASDASDASATGAPGVSEEGDDKIDAANEDARRVAPAVPAHVVALEQRLDRDLELVARERKSMRKRIARLKELRQQLETRNSALVEEERAAANDRTRIDEQRAEIDNRSNELAGREDALATRGGEIDAAETKLAADRKDLSRRETDVEARELDAESQRNSLLAMSKELSARESESRDRRARLEADEQKFRQEKQAFEERTRQSTENLEGLANQLEEAFAEAEAAREHAERHETELAALQQQVDSDRGQWRQEKERLLERIGHLQQQTASTEQVEQELARERERRGALQAALEKQQHEHETARQQWDALRDRLEAEIQSRKRRMEELPESEKAVLLESERRESLERELNEVRAEFAAKTAVHDREKQELMAALASLRAKLKERGVSSHDALATIEGSARQLREASRRLREVQGRLRQFENQWIETDELVDEVADPRALDQLMRRREALATQLENAHSSRDALLAELQNIAERFGRPLAQRS